MSASATIGRVPRWRAVVCAAMLTVSGCGQGAPPASLAGTWRIATWGQPGATMLVQAEVMPYLTAPLHMEARAARFGDRVCPQASFIPRGVALTIGETDAVRLFRPRSRVTEAFELACNGQPWTDPGRRILVLDDGALVTEWRGRFFLLERMP